MRIEVIQPGELSPGDIARWRTYQDLDPALASPYLTPEWAQIVAAARKDVRLCVLDGGQGFFGVQRPSRFAALGLGAPISDYQAVIAPPGLEIEAGALCRALKVGRIDLTGVPEGQSLLSAPAGAHGSWIAAVENGTDEYRWSVKERRSKFVKDLDKKLRKLEADKGKPVFTATSADASHFETLLAWKAEQLSRSGQPQIWNTPWVRQVLDACFAAKGPHFGGQLFTLTIDGRLIAANFFLRSERVLHGWVISHDKAFDAYSPGVLLARWAIEWAGANGVSEVEFGPGDYQFKRQLATGQRQLQWGAVSGGSLSGAVRHAEFGLRAQIEKLPNKRLAALPGKAMRKLDLLRALAA